MTFSHSKICDHPTTGDQGTTHKLKPRSFTKSYSILTLFHPAVTPYKRLGKISDILHLNNENNQLERQAWPPKDVPLDTQLWTWAYHLSSRVVAVTTTTETS